MPLRLFLPLILIAGLLLMREAHVAPLNGVEDRFSAWLSREAAALQASGGGRKQPSIPITLLEINDEELGFKAWPWSPFDYSLAVHGVVDFQPNLLALEPFLTWEKPNLQQVVLLNRQLLNAPRLVMSAAFAESGETRFEGTASVESAALRFEGKREDLAGLPEYGEIAAFPEEALRLVGKIGFTNLGDSVIHQGEHSRLEKLPLVFRYRGKLLPSFALQVAMQLYGVTPDETVVIPGDSILLGQELRIPIDNEGTMRILYGTKVERLTVSDLLLAAERQGSEEAAKSTAKVKGAIVLLGRTDSGVGKLRFANSTYAPVEIVAHALATIQEKAFLRQVSVAVELAIIAASMALAVWFFRIGKLWSLFASFGTAALYGLASLWLASGMGLALPLVLPAGLLVFILGARQLQ